MGYTFCTMSPSGIGFTNTENTSKKQEVIKDGPEARLFLAHHSNDQLCFPSPELPQETKRYTYSLLSSIFP